MIHSRKDKTTCICYWRNCKKTVVISFFPKLCWVLKSFLPSLRKFWELSCQVPVLLAAMSASLIWNSKRLHLRHSCQKQRYIYNHNKQGDILGRTYHDKRLCNFRTLLGKNSEKNCISWNLYEYWNAIWKTGIYKLSAASGQSKYSRNLDLKTLIHNSFVSTDNKPAIRQ